MKCYNVNEKYDLTCSSDTCNNVRDDIYQCKNEKCKYYNLKQNDKCILCDYPQLYGTDAKWKCDICQLYQLYLGKDQI